MEDKMKSVSRQMGTLIGCICGVLLSAGLIMWGWNTVAPHFNAPVFTYWEVLIVRLALQSITNIFRKKS